VVARGEGHDPAGALLGGKQGQAREGAPGLEGADALEDLGLEEDPGADPLVDLARGEDRGAVNVRADALAGRPHVVEGDG
jgi:hypothetical protein